MQASDSETKTQSQQTSAADSATEGVTGRAEALYDRFTERARTLFEASQEKTKEALEAAMESAREQIASAGEFSAEQGESFKRYMRRDMEQTTDDMRALGKEAAQRLHPARLGAGALSSIAQMLEATGSALHTLSRRTEDALHFNTGDITAAGTLTCSHCGHKLQLTHTSEIPACPGCHATEFRKGY